MSARRIAVVIVLLLSACCFALAGFVFFTLQRVEAPERYIGIGVALVMLYMGGAMVAGVIWPPKPKDPNVPIVIPPRDQVRGRTSYRDDSTQSRNVVLFIGAIFLAVSLSAAPGQPIVLVIAVIAAGVIAGAGVMTLRQMQYGRARLELDMPARRGDTIHGVITTSGSAWATADPEFEASVELNGYGTGAASATAHEIAITSVTRNGNDLAVRFTVTIPVVDTSEGRFSWNAQLETHAPDYRATFVIDVA
jgi:hypothetical protein